MAADKMDGQIDFLGLIEEYTDAQGATVRVKTPTARKQRASKEADANQLKLDFIDLDAEYEAELEALETADKEPETVSIEKEQENPEPVKKPDVTPKTDEAKPQIDEDKPQTVKKSKAGAKNKVDKSAPEDDTHNSVMELLFKQCKRCWCRDCKHNSRNEGVPREMCGMNIPCPACTGCIEEDMATICEIGNAKEGCMFRAIEEGIYVPEEVE